jgi:hypothetical protein
MVTWVRVNNLAYFRKLIIHYNILARVHDVESSNMCNNNSSTGK